MSPSRPNWVFHVCNCVRKSGWYTSSDLLKLGLEGFNLLTLGAGVFVDEITDTLQAGELQTVGVSEAQALDRSGTVVPSLGCFYLVIEKDDLRTGPPEDLVGGPDLAEYRVGISLHSDSSSG